MVQHTFLTGLTLIDLTAGLFNRKLLHYMRVYLAHRVHPQPLKEGDIMNNAEYIRLMKKQREREKMKEAEVVEQLKIEDPEPDQAEDIQEVEADVITDSENGDNESDTES